MGKGQAEKGGRREGGGGGEGERGKGECRGGGQWGGGRGRSTFACLEAVQQKRIKGRVLIFHLSSFLVTSCFIPFRPPSISNQLSS